MQGFKLQKGIYTDIGYRWQFNQFDRSDHDDLLDFHNAGYHKPIHFYNSKLFNYDTYIKSDQDVDNDFPIADIWIRLAIDQFQHTRIRT